MLKRIRLMLAGLTALALAIPASAQPTATATWTNFIGTSTQWSVGANWIGTAPTLSNVDNVLWFGSSTLQTGSGYTSTYATGAYNVNALVFNSQAASNPSIIIQGAAAGDQIVFTNSSTSVSPSIWQMGTGRAVIQAGSGTAPVISGGAQLQILGSGIGELQILSTIGQTGGNGSILVNQTGTQPFYSGALTRLGANTSTYAGGLTLTSGNLSIGSPNASTVGTTTTALGTGTFTVNGGTLQFSEQTITTGWTVANAVTLNSTLVITGNAAATAPTNMGTFTGALSGAGGLTFSPTATLSFAFTNTNTFNGEILLSAIGNAATNVTLGAASGAGVTGTAANASGYTVNANSSLILDYGASTNVKLNAASPMTLNRGNVLLRGNASLPVADSVGTLNAEGMGLVSVLNQLTGSQTTQITFAGLNRVGGFGTLALIGTNLGSGTGAGESRIVFTADPGGAVGGGGLSGTTNRNILPYAYADSAASTTGAAAANVLGLVRWDSATGRIVPLSTTNEYAANLYLAGTSAPNDNQRLVSTSALPNAFGVAGLNSATTANALVLDTNTTATNRVGVSIAGTGALTVGGGAVLVGTNGNSANTVPSNASLINVSELKFGSTTGYIHAVAPLVINSPITGSGGLVKSGVGTLALNGANTFTGGLILNAGAVNFSSDSNLGNAGGGISLNSGLTTGLAFLPNNLFSTANSPTVTVNRTVAVGSSGGVFNVSLGSNALTMSGAFSGSGQVVKSGTGIMNVTGNNSTFNGNWSVAGGVLAFKDDAALGSSSAGVVLSGATFQPLNDFTTSKNFLVAATSNLFTNGKNLTVNGNITSQNAVAGLLKIGLGDLTLTGTNSLMGGLQVGVSNPSGVIFGSAPSGAQASGRVVLSGTNGSLPLTASVFAIAQGEFVMDNTDAINNNRIGAVTVLPVGGSIVLKGNQSGTVNEQVGSISLNNASNPYGGTVTISTPAGSGQLTQLNSTVYTPAPQANIASGTLFVRGTNLGGASGDRSALVFSAAPTLTPASTGIVASMVGANSESAEPTDFVTTQTITVPAPNSNQFGIVMFSGYTAGIGANGAGASANTYDLTGAQSFAGTSAANALKLRGASVDLNAGTMTVTAGAVLSTSASTSSISNGTLAFGTAPARFTVTTGSDLTLSVGSTGTGGLVKTGKGTLILNSASSITSTASTGSMAIGEGTLRYGVANALPTATALFINSGATVDINGTTSTLATINGYGNVALGNGSLTVGSVAQSFAMGGALSGNGNFILSGTQNFTICGDSTAGFTGGVQVLGGAANTGTGTSGLIVLSSGALGTGTSPILLGATTGTNQGSMVLGTALQSFSRDITVQAGATPTNPHTLLTQASTINITSNIVMNQQLRISNTGNNTGNATLNGTISGAGNLNVFFGSWTFNGNNSYSGGTTIDSGASAAMGLGSDSTVTTGPLGTGAVTFTTSGGNLRADGGARTVSNNLVLNSGAYFGVAGTNDLTLSGTVSLNAGATAPTVNIMSTGVTTISNTISNSTIGFNKVGPGTLVLSGNNNYGGTTTVNAGILRVNNTTGSGTGTSTITVNSGAILGGTGFIGGITNINAGAIIAPGNSVGTLTVNNAVNLNNGGIYNWEINGYTPTPGAINTGLSTDLANHDQVASTGVFTGGNFVLKISEVAAATYTVGNTYSWTIATGTGTPTFGTVAFDLSGAPLINSLGGASALSITAAIGQLNLNFTPVPEPATILGLSAGAFAIGGLVRRRFRKSA